MRTTIRKSVLVAFLFGTLISYANDMVNPVDGERLKSAVIEVKKGEVFTIKNEEGVSLYRSTVTDKGNFQKAFDLTDLEDGVYITELEKTNEVEVKKLMVKANEVTFLDEKMIYKPVVRTKGDLLLVSKLNFNKDPLAVKIYYNGEVIFKESIVKNEAILKRIYKLSISERGDYSVVFKVNGRTFEEKFSI